MVELIVAFSEKFLGRPGAVLARNGHASPYTLVGDPKIPLETPAVSVRGYSSLLLMRPVGDSRHVATGK